MKKPLRGLLIFAVGITAVALSVGVIATLTAGPLAPSDDAQIKIQVKAAVNLVLQVSILPSGSSPGHVTAEAAAQIQRHIVDDLPKVMTGKLLAAQTQGDLDYLRMVQADERTGCFSEAQVDSITFGAPAVVSGSFATISGSYESHAVGYHFEHGVRVDEGRMDGTQAFTAQIAKENGIWLVSLISLTGGVALANHPVQAYDRQEGVANIRREPSQ